MSFNFASNVQELAGESTLVYQEIARKVSKEKGIKTINFGIGQPDLVTFKRIRDSAITALQDGFTGYTPALGIDELREKIAQYLNRYGDVKKDNVIVTPGAKTALFLGFILFVNPGDEVIVDDPSFYSYAEVIRLLGAKPVFLRLNMRENGFSHDLKSLEELITPRTKMIVINNPHNPTGSLFDPHEIERIMEISKERKIILMSDEIYDNFVYEGKMKSALEDPDWKDYVIYINGFSKTFSMTGWRLGYVAAREDIIKKMGVLAGNIYTCATSFAQKGAIASFDSFDEVKDMIELFRKRRDVMYSELQKVKKIKVIKPQGAFYMFPYMGDLLRAMGMEIKDFSVELIKSKGVITIPGEVFPKDVGKDHVRLSFAVKEQDIKEGVKKIAEFVDERLQSEG
ncbi:pyridoxal phosphate-dependent aminotransferase [Sulfuracidifex tepidarius]|uniref:Aminotransferase n=1 Tax=Sulfuracidifex tepidarius TaxID=1294262 RepID=A0A510DUB3_9CREN|nr:pyridoxal phosphate-dependent aminotransferase [Sulfuracidifex tepidarius]BBG23812.1 Aspartate aminotransferase [Sulfuracidifex tepidarius]BBG26567.1 Aspartate aminotransferase [Sulfuracidifex tepidarius]